MAEAEEESAKAAYGKAMAESEKWTQDSNSPTDKEATKTDLMHSLAANERTRRRLAWPSRWEV